MNDHRPEDYIKSVGCPILIMQAKTDHMVPADSATRLHANARPPRELIYFKGKHDTPSETVAVAAAAFLDDHLSQAESE